MDKFVRLRVDYDRLAKASGVSAPHIRNIIHRNNNVRPSPELAEKLAKISGLSRDIWVFGSTDEIINGLKEVFLDGATRP